MSTLSQFFGSQFKPDEATATIPGLNTTYNPYHRFGGGTTIYALDERPFVIPINGTICGGYLICARTNTAWIVAPSSAEVSRSWTNRNDANTTAQSVSGCTGWFVPTITQLQNPGYACRKFWDSFSSTCYWSSTECLSTYACVVCFNSGIVSACNRGNTICVRAFRCVTY